MTHRSDPRPACADPDLAELLTDIAAALAPPPAALGAYDAYAGLIAARAISIRYILEDVGDRPVAHLRARLDKLLAGTPVTYPVWKRQTEDGAE